MYCEVCMEDSKLVCSACKVTRYCSAECQLVDWKIHKKGCKMNQLLEKINKEMREKPPARPVDGRCTGCNLKFDDEDEDEDEGEGNYCVDECAECGYQVCDDCAVDTSHGTCYCEKKNFGNWYCEMSPRWYHGNGRGASYKGDRHPQHDDEHSPEDYEDQPRKCNNCGEVALMLKN